MGRIVTACGKRGDAFVPCTRSRFANESAHKIDIKRSPAQASVYSSPSCPLIASPCCWSSQTPQIVPESHKISVLPLVNLICLPTYQFQLWKTENFWTNLNLNSSSCIRTLLCTGWECGENYNSHFLWQLKAVLLIQINANFKNRNASTTSEVYTLIYKTMNDFL